VLRAAGETENHTRKYPRLTCAGFQLLTEEEIAAVIFIFINTIIKFPIYLFCLENLHTDVDINIA
jgi:hypothetical protein